MSRKATKGSVRDSYKGNVKADKTGKGPGWHEGKDHTGVAPNHSHARKYGYSPHERYAGYGPAKVEHNDAVPKYEVVVGNIGTVYSGDDYSEAMEAFMKYREDSGTGMGRAGGEDVMMFSDGDLSREHTGFLYDVPSGVINEIKDIEGDNEIKIVSINHEAGIEVPDTEHYIVKVEFPDGEIGTFRLFKHQSDSITEAESLVYEMFMEDPSLFTHDFLKEQIDTERLADALVNDMYDSDYDQGLYDWESENPEKASRLSILAKKHSEFPNFMTFREEESELYAEYQRLQTEMEEYAEANAQYTADRIREDPIDWWEEATGEKLPGFVLNYPADYFNTDNVMEEAVAVDGPAHFLAHYDGDEVEVGSKDDGWENAVMFRID